MVAPHVCLYQTVLVLQAHSQELKAAQTVLVVGGGAVGVELAGEFCNHSLFTSLYSSV